MPNLNKAADTVLRDLLRQFPDAPALTLAKRAYGQNPSLWANLDACRSAVRKHFGQIGDRNRKTSLRKEFRRPARPPGWTGHIPPALAHYDDWNSVTIGGPLRSLVISDLHIPYHAEEAVRVAIKYGIERRANLILLNGDLFDFFGLSQWEKDPRKRDFPAEVRSGKQFLKAVRLAFPRARIIFKEGNHEERWERYLRLKAPELLGLPEFTWQEVYGLSELKIQFVGERRPVKLGKLTFIHGHEYRFNISNPVNPARGLFLRAKTHAACGHFHQTSQHSEKNLDQNVISTWSVGCLCDLHPDYAPLNQWNHGFGFVEVDSGGAFHVDNLRIIEGRAY